MAPLRIEVTGEATIYRPAERAVLSIAVRSEGKSLDDVMKDVVNESSHVKSVLSKLAEKDHKGQSTTNAAITHWSNSTLSTGSYNKYSDDGKKSTRIHNASITFEAKFQDFKYLGSCTTSLSSLKNVSISGIEWRLTDKTKNGLTTQCRHQAVRDAVAKAADYAAALDRSAPRVTEIRDTDSSYSVHNETRAYAAYEEAEGSGGGISFAPEDVSLNCSVLVICEEK